MLDSCISFQIFSLEIPYINLCMISFKAIFIAGCKPETNKKVDAIEKELVSDLQAVITSWKERMSERGGLFELEEKA